MRPLLASLFDSLDGVTYFFVSSGIFVLMTAALFFGLGLWIGALTWGRFKRRFRAGQETIEDMKNELALLKRRTADLASRGLSNQQGQARGAPRSSLAALVQSASYPPLPPAAAFTIWTEPGWVPRSNSIPRLPASAAFTLWPQPVAPVEFVPAAAAGTGEAQQVVAAAAPPVKSVTGFPKAGAATPTFGDWLHSRGARSENGDSSAPQRSISPGEAFHVELSGGTVRNDYLLGIVFNTPPQPCDDLSKLEGITESERNGLEAYGVHRFKQIAFWDHDHADEFARRIGLKDKRRAINWIGQASRFLQETGGAVS